MRIRRRGREVPELNTTSTADISFMLLIFFLVTTSMYEARGLQGQLPPKDSEKEKKEIIVDKENIMALALDAEGRLTVNDSLVEIGRLKGQMEEFLLRRGKEHLLIIDASPECRYENYFQLQQVIAKAYKDVRAELGAGFPQRIAENYHEKEGEGE